MFKNSKGKDMLGLGSDRTSRTVFLSRDVTEDSIRDVMEQLVDLADEDHKKPIVLVVNTLGGDVYETMALYDLIKYIQTPVHTVGLGKIMSAGALILACGTKGHRKIGNNAMLMYHAGREGAFGDIWEQERLLKEFKRQERQYDELVASETGLTYEQVLALYANDRLDNYLPAHKAIELGFADKLI